MANKDSSFHFFDKYRKLLKIVNFYEHQIDVLDKMLDEFSAKYIKCALSTEKVQFHKAFAEKQKSIADLKSNINHNNKIISAEFKHKQADSNLKFEEEELKMERYVKDIEKEVNELSREFKSYLIRKL